MRAYAALFGTNNPNLPLFAALKEAGVRITVCGQSLTGRDLPTTDVAPDVEVATSMLTHRGHVPNAGVRAAAVLVAL